MHFRSLEDKCRYYQELTNYHLLPNSYILVHCDGKNFSRLIKNNFKKPFDDEFIKMMNKTAKFLCENIQGCKLAYTQSDEISLLITDFDKPESDTLFGGRLCKMQSIIASLATAKFNQLMTLYNMSNGLGMNPGDCIMKTTGKNQSRTTTKRSVTLRLDAFDYKCLELLALKNKYTISKQIALLLAASTATIRATVSEAELDEMITLVLDTVVKFSEK